MMSVRRASEKRTNNGLVFQNFQEALEALNAEDKGRYFLCDCPECQQHEAFIYKNNTNFISCNRENECGETMRLFFRERLSEVDVSKLSLAESYPELTKEQVDALDWLNRATRHFQTYVPTKTFEQGYRGISEDVARDFVADFFNEDMVGFMFDKVKPLLGKDYSKNDWMRKRNLVFPIRGEDGEVERILLRSSYAELEPKEIQLIVNPSKDTRDFFVDLPEDAQTIVIAEAIFDGMSFREVDSNIGLMALTGSTKTRGIKEFIHKNKHLFSDKCVVLAMDNDVAGWKANQEIMTALEDCWIDYQLFLYPKNMKDSNQYLKESQYGFEQRFERVKESFLSSNRDLIDIKKDSNTVIICDSRLDGITFRTVDENVGVIALDADEQQKASRLSKHIIQNENVLRGKKIILALPNNAVGEKIATSLKKVLDTLELEYTKFIYPSPKKYPYVKTPYEYSKESRKDFRKSVEKSFSSFNKKKTLRINKAQVLEKER